MMPLPAVSLPSPASYSPAIRVCQTANVMLPLTALYEAMPRPRVTPETVFRAKFRRKYVQMRMLTWSRGHNAPNACSRHEPVVDASVVIMEEVDRKGKRKALLPSHSSPEASTSRACPQIQTKVGTPEGIRRVLPHAPPVPVRR